MEVKYLIENRTVVLELEGEVVTGSDNVLLLEDKNLLDGTPWNEQGYTIQSFLTDEQFLKVKEGMTNKIRDLIVRVGGKADDDFTLEQYHNYVNDEQHLKIARLIQHGWNVSEFPVDFSLVNERISAILGKTVNAEAKHLNVADFNTGLSPIEYSVMCIFNLRIVRPGKMQDNNPPHRDGWMDRLRNAVNIYVPLCGSAENSALPVVPASHFFNESEIERTAQGALLNGIKYSVPCVTTVRGEIPVLVRPNPKENEVMVFSPYLIHGG